MRHLPRRCAGILALALLVGGPAHAPALTQDERPDLKLELVGLNPSNPREVRFQVTNVGEWWADTTTATVETVAPTAGNKDTTDVPDLGPKGDKETASQFEFTYKLAADCDGYEVKASLAAAKTSNGNKETNLGNNEVPKTRVCDKKGSSAPVNPRDQGIVSKPGVPVNVMAPDGSASNPSPPPRFSDRGTQGPRGRTPSPCAQRGPVRIDVAGQRGSHGEQDRLQS